MSEDQQDQQQTYVDPNSGAAPQPGGYAFREPVREDMVDVAVADETTEAQEQNEGDVAPPPDNSDKTESEQVEDRETETQASGDTVDESSSKKRSRKS